ncbi:ABC transporter substrate-binding protein [Paenibacillus validus]|uniref:ABC transporter substrate-binding protein n=1 Tax=Paenibacillus validus TaxID=44253 RepID=A0A7X3CRV6_9BACL|nr:ABC transporter substrate-binding protein [Paenibacillus validus]MUG70642.1 ABC transporter substrate-binding protein [Paenibacillus validus]
MESKKRFKIFLSLILMLSVLLSACQEKPSSGPGTNAAGEPKMGGTLKVATTGEPPTLDPTQTTAYSAQEIGWHIYEGLFTIDENYNATPMLAKDYVFDEAKNTYTIHLREGIKFHNGKQLSADDVVASLNRWGKKANYGKILFQNLQELKKVDDLTIDIVLKSPSPIVPILLAFPNQQSAIFPKEIVEAAGDGEIKQYIGTGPYRFVEHKPDQYIKLARFEDYKPLEGPAKGMGGSRKAYLDEILFIPTPETSVRLDGVQTGQFDFAEQVNSDMYKQIQANNQVDALITKPYWFTQIVFNKKSGPFTDKRLRQAFSLALDMKPMMQAAFASEEFYRLDPSIMFKEQKEWWSEAGKENYNQANLEKAKKLMEEAGYKGEKLRWLTTKEYDFMYKNSLVATEQLKKIGFNIELQVVDYATIVSKRMKPEEYEIFMGATTFTPDPGIWPIWESSWPGFWVDPKKDEMVKKLNSEMDPKERKKHLDALQAYFWEEVPLLKVGDFFVLSVKTKEVKGLEGTAFPFYWNVWKE